MKFKLLINTEIAKVNAIFRFKLKPVIYPAYNQVEEAVREKRRCFKLWKAGGSRAAYNTAKRTSNRVVHQAKSEAEKVALQKVDARS